MAYRKLLKEKTIDLFASVFISVLLEMMKRIVVLLREYGYADMSTLLFDISKTDFFISLCNIGLIAIVINAISKLANLVATKNEGKVSRLHSLAMLTLLLLSCFWYTVDEFVKPELVTRITGASLCFIFLLVLTLYDVRSGIKQINKEASIYNSDHRVA